MSKKVILSAVLATAMLIPAISSANTKQDTNNQAGTITVQSTAPAATDASATTTPASAADKSAKAEGNKNIAKQDEKKTS